MALYRYTITPRAAFATPMRSDTLYGHLLWAAAMRGGPRRVEALIEAFAAGRPPFTLSSAMPTGRLPMPKLPGIPRERFEERFAAGKDLKKRLEDFKEFRKNQHWPTALWLRRKGSVSMETLFTEWLDWKKEADPAIPWDTSAGGRATTHQPHVSIDRQSGSVLAGGGLYFSQGTWYGRGTTLDLYVDTEDSDAFETLFKHVAAVGFGADRSTGRGQFDYARDEAFDPAPFQAAGSHRLNLSVCTAAEMSAFAGYWEPFIKHGRAWSGFGEANPFKKPFFAFAEGSVFSRMPADGYLLRNIHSDPKIVQVGWPLTIPITMEEEHAD